MNHEQEKEQEIETLGYIYQPDELQVDGNVLNIVLSSEETRFQVQVTLPELYPEEIPQLELFDCDLHQEDQDTLLQEALEVAKDSLGMAMVYTITSFLLDRYQTLKTDRQLKEEAERERIALEQEKLENERYQGTRTTQESFAKWHKSFIQEAHNQKKSGQPLSLAQQAALAVDMMGAPKGDKLTGRQLFERDTSLVKSDMQYGEEEGVAVDISLFEGIEDLDLEDEDDNQVLLGLTEDD